MGREPRDFVRRSGLRDATLFVIASEGAVTEPRYFNGLKERWHSPRVHVEVLRRVDPTQSSPEKVLSDLDEFARRFSLREGDQLWLVIDRDPQSWKQRTVAKVARECVKKKYFLALSDPCFELWLLLHFEDVPNQSPLRKDQLRANAADLLKSEVSRYCSGQREYIDNFIESTEIAIERAKTLDIKPGDRWPSQLGTRVYRLVGQILPRPI